MRLLSLLTAVALGVAGLLAAPAVSVAQVTQERKDLFKPKPPAEKPAPPTAAEQKAKRGFGQQPPAQQPPAPQPPAAAGKAATPPATAEKAPHKGKGWAKGHGKGQGKKKGYGKAMEKNKSASQ